MKQTSKRVVVECDLCGTKYFGSTRKSALAALWKHEWRKHKKEKALIRRVFSEEPARGLEPLASSADVPPAPGWEDLKRAETVQLIGVLVSPPEPPPLFLTEIDGPPELELDQDLCAMLEGLAGIEPSPVEEAVALRWRTRRPPIGTASQKKR